MAKRPVKRKPKAKQEVVPFTVEDFLRLSLGDMPSDEDMLFWSSPGALPSEERAAAQAEERKP